jgi:tetratricopeptide (TPR) repeat protein
MKMGQVEEGQSILDEAVFHYRQTGNPRAISAMYTFLGGVLIQQEKYHEAKPLLLEALAFQEKIDDWIYMKMALAWLGEVYEELGDYPQATTYYEKSLTVSQGNGDRLGIAVASGHLGRVSLALNKPQQAERYLADALSLARQIQFMPVVILSAR